MCTFVTRHIINTQGMYIYSFVIVCDLRWMAWRIRSRNCSFLHIIFYYEEYYIMLSINSKLFDLEVIILLRHSLNIQYVLIYNHRAVVWFCCDCDELILKVKMLFPQPPQKHNKAIYPVELMTMNFPKRDLILYLTSL